MDVQHKTMLGYITQNKMRRIPENTNIQAKKQKFELLVCYEYINVARRDMTSKNNLAWEGKDWDMKHVQRMSISMSLDYWSPAQIRNMAWTQQIPKGLRVCMCLAGILIQVLLFGFCLFVFKVIVHNFLILLSQQEMFFFISDTVMNRKSRR